MLQVSFDVINGSRQKIQDHILEEKNKNPDFTVVDIGGQIGDRREGLVDFIADINAEDSYNSMKFDVCSEQNLDELMHKGRFDFAICTHTLEDVCYPIAALEWLPSIARSGIITMPSASLELTRNVEGPWLGYIHHRWIFDYVDGRMLVVPKINALETMILGDGLGFKNDQTEIQFWWTTDIEFDVFMDNYLGPNVNTIYNSYLGFLSGVKERYK
jgi:hypothetical protein